MFGLIKGRDLLSMKRRRGCICCVETRSVKLTIPTHPHTPMRFQLFQPNGAPIATTAGSISPVRRFATLYEEGSRLISTGPHPWEIKHCSSLSRSSSPFLCYFLLVICINTISRRRLNYSKRPKLSVGASPQPEGAQPLSDGSCFAHHARRLSSRVN